MKKRRIGVLAFGTIVLVASALIGAPSAAADTTITTTMTTGGDNPCTGEAFTGTGNMRMVTNDSVGLDGSIHHHLATYIDGLKAYTATGKRYVVQETYFDEYNFVGASEETFDITAHYIRQGEDGAFVLGDDFYERLHTHITTNDAGIPTAFQYSMTPADQTCQ